MRHNHMQAYRRVAGKSKMLPGLSDYTNDQLFFIAFGQVLGNMSLPDIFIITPTQLYIFIISVWALHSRNKYLLHVDLFK